jgi:hypothetical protein
MNSDEVSQVIRGGGALGALVQARLVDAARMLPGHQ